MNRIRLGLILVFSSLLCGIAADIPASHGVPALRDRLWQTRLGPLKAGTMGDFVGIGLFEAALPALHSAFGTNGAVSANEFTGIGMWTGSNVVTGVASWSDGAVRVDLPSTNWFAAHYRIPAGGLVTWTNRGAPDSLVQADRGCISYIAGPGYGEFKVRISTNNSAWADIATINAEDTSRHGVVYTFDLSAERYKLQVLGVSGEAVVVNAGLWDEGSGGLRTTEMWGGGISIGTITALPEAIWKPIFNNLDLDILFWEMKDCQGEVSTNLFAAFWPGFQSMLAKGFPGTTIVLVGTTPQRDNNDLLLWQNSFVRDRAIEAGWVYWDGYTPLQSYETALAEGWLSDASGIIPSKSGNSVRAEALFDEIGISRLSGDLTRSDDSLLFKVQLQGVPGRRFILQESSDLMTWTNLSTNVCSQEVFSYSDASVTNQPAVFYRALPTN